MIRAICSGPVPNEKVNSTVNLNAGTGPWLPSIHLAGECALLDSPILENVLGMLT
jgi:hypothetical protein